MSRANTWQRFNVIVGSPRNPDYDRLKGRANGPCPNHECKHTHGMNRDVCSWYSRDREGRIRRCNCVMPQREVGLQILVDEAQKLKLYPK